MKLEINNSTLYSKKELRKIFLLCLKEIIRSGRCKKERLDDFFVETIISHASNNDKEWVGGYANYYSSGCTIKLPNKGVPIPLKNIAMTFIHEVGHCLGIKHNQFGRHQNYSGASTIECFYLDWIKKTFGENVISPIEKKKIKINHVDKRYKSALLNLQKAKTRLKRAETLYKKWNKKVKYYEKKNK